VDIKSLLQPNQELELTVWDEEDEDGLTYTAKIKQTKANHILVDMPLSQPVLMRRMVVGVLVGAVASLYQDVVIFYPVIHERQDTGEIGFWLRLPEQYEVVQRRRHVRVPMEIPFQVDCYVGVSRQSHDALTLNLSGGGVRFSCARQFVTGELIKLRLQLNGNTPAMTLSGEVVFSQVNGNRKGSHFEYVTAVQFKGLTHQQEAALVGECFRREIRMRPPETR
jgi:c-di-GMP-binding flagellar brake protein YcgR